MAAGTKYPQRSVHFFIAVLVLTVAAASSLPAADSDLIERGRDRYENDCASCHGETAKGDGAVGAALTIPPTDLTILSRPFAGEFPEDYVRRVIDGRDLPPIAHGLVAMPVWGRHYKRNLPGYSELLVQQKIDALVAYLRSIQIVPPQQKKS